MVGIGSKYMVGLAQVSTASVMGTPMGYLLRGNAYNKQEDDIFAPRFNTGAEGLNDLDLWKTWQMTDFSGGSFQDVWQDTTKFQLLKNAELNPIDNRLYPTPKKATCTLPASMRTARQHWAVYRNELYIITNGSGSVGTAFGAVAKYAPSTKTFTNVKADFATGPSSLVVLGDKLWVATTNGLVWSFDGTTWTSDSRYGFGQIKKFGNLLMCTGATTTTDEGKLWSRDTTAGSGAVVSYIGEVGDYNKPIVTMEEFNHRFYMGKSDGLFAYDGVLISCIIDLSKDQDARNFKAMVTYNGALYFILKNALYRLTGTTLEKVREFANYETVSTLTAADGRLYIGTYVTTAATGMGQAAADCRLYYYDGVGFFCYDGTTTGVNSAFEPCRIMYLNDGTYRHLIFEISGSSGIGDNTAYCFNQALQFGNGSNSVYNDLEIYTSEFDGGFPYIDKYNDSATLSYEGALTGDTLTASWRINDGTTWGAFSSTIGGVFRKLQFKLVLSRVNASSGLSLTSFSLRYYLSPDLKRKWNMTMLCVGQSDTPLELEDYSTETTTAKLLREQIYACRANDTPSILFDIDTTTATGTHTSGVTTINVASTAMFPNSGYAYNDTTGELFLYTGKTATSFTGVTRGRWGTTATAMAASDSICSAYRVLLKIVSDRVIAPATVDGVMNTYGNEAEVSVIIREA
jgi:hypothetical protein